MIRHSSRRRGSRFYLPRKFRLAISVSALILLILAVILIVKGCGGDAQPADPVSDTAVYPNETAPTEEASVSESFENVPAADVPSEPEAASPPTETVSSVPPEGALPFGNRRAVIRSAGDIVVHKPLLKTAYRSADKSYDFSPFFSQISSSLQAADYTVINVDGPLGGKKFAAYRGYPQFNTPPYILNTLVDCGVDMLTLANNHALDTYFDGLKATVDNVEKVGLKHVGAYRTQEEHDTPMVVSIGGIQVGFTNYTVSTNNMSKRSDPEASVYGLRMVSNSNAPADIQALRNAGAEIVIVYMHWGEEYLREVSNDLKSMASKLVAAGADVVIGGHQHVVLPCEQLTVTDSQGQSHTGLVLYGMGNFLSDQRARYKDSGIIFEITLEDNPATGKVEVTSPKYIPTYVQRTKGSSSYDYQVLPVGATLENPPSSIPSDVLARIREVWDEQEVLFSGGPATAARE